MYIDEHGGGILYQIPLRFIKASKDVDICATRIIVMMSTKTYQARETLKEERKAGTLINACGTKAAKTAIFMDNGAIVSSPIDHNRLVASIEKSNIKGETAYHTRRLKVYDVADEEPRPDIDTPVPEMTAEVSEDEEE